MQLLYIIITSFAKNATFWLQSTTLIANFVAV